MAQRKPTTTPSHPASTSEGATRCLALIGPQGTGKTSLLEAMLAVSGALPQQGSVETGDSFGDSQPEARARQMGLEINFARMNYLGDPWQILDCPGAPSFMPEARAALQVADCAVLVADSDADHPVMLSPWLQMLAESGIPHFLFLNRLDLRRDTEYGYFATLLEQIGHYAHNRLVLRHTPIREGEQIRGYVDLAADRAYAFASEGASTRIGQDLSADASQRAEQAAREMLETLADYDDELLEQLIEEEEPPSPSGIYHHLRKEFQAASICPVLLGSAVRTHGVRRLLKALRHEVPGVEFTRERVLDAACQEESSLLGVFRVRYQPHLGRTAWARVWAGTLGPQDAIGPGSRPQGIFLPHGMEQERCDRAQAGEIVALPRLDETIGRGHRVSFGRQARIVAGPESGPCPPMAWASLLVERKQDDLKLSATARKLTEEDAGSEFVVDGATGAFVLGGQSQLHLSVLLERLRSQHGVAVSMVAPQPRLFETIRGHCTRKARFKRQSGGHGQFADVCIEVRPLERGEGFVFEDRITGGAIARGFIPAVEQGLRDAMERGPLGEAVTDIGVALVDGKMHPVDSSEMAFRTAGRMALQEALAECDPFRLEPWHRVTLFCPGLYTSRIQRLVPAHRGQLLGFGLREGWREWEQVDCAMPLIEVRKLATELHSATQGIGTFFHAYEGLRPAPQDL